MDIRERLENAERKNLSKYAKLSSETKGRRFPDDKCKVRTDFQRDQDRIIHSVYFRKLKHKTNVFLSTTGEEFRTRLTHTLEVSQIAKTICRSLNLNEDLAAAIALGHDLGHTPFGHTGEEILNKLSPFGFDHARQSLKVVDFLEKNGSGLNLTSEVRDGILKHTKGSSNLKDFQKYGGRMGKPVTLEGTAVQYADWIAYINHDIDDAMNMGLIKNSDLPEKAIKILGNRHSARISAIIYDIVEQSFNKPGILISKKIAFAIEKLRKYLYNNVYTMPAITGHGKQARKILTALYKYYFKNPDSVYKHFPYLRKEAKAKAVTDYISFLTDAEAVDEYHKTRTVKKSLTGFKR